jgi:hypothetical protein
MLCDRPRSLKFFFTVSSFVFKSPSFILTNYNPLGLAIATVTIFIRSTYRVAELSQGFHGKLANQETTFMILEGAMIIIGVTAITILHPYFAFGGPEGWTGAAWHLRGGKSVGDEAHYKGSQNSDDEYGQMRR